MRIYNYIYVFYYFFSIIFSWLFLGIFLENKTYTFNTLSVALSLVIFFVLSIYIHKAIYKYHYFLANHEKIIIFLFFGALFIAHIFLGYLLAVETSWDTEAVYKGAVNLSTTKTLGNYQDYFHIFPHNLGATYILSSIFSGCAFFGYTDYYFIGTIFNVISIDIGIFFIYLICKELKDIKAALMALWLSLICLPLHFYTPIFYTDTLSFPFIAALYYLYLATLRADKISIRLAYGFLFGALLAIGSEIKFTVMILAIAVFIDSLIRKKALHTLPSMLTAMAIFFVITISFNDYRFDSLLNKEISDQKRVPYTHWIMMGLTGNGSYNGEDYQYTYSFPSQEDRIDANLARIKNRLNEFGVWGYIDFIYRKQHLNFGSGIYAVNEMIDDNPIRRNALHEFNLDGGKYFDIFKSIAQGYHIFIFAIIILSTFVDAASKNPNSIKIFAGRLAIMGIFIFLMLWEASSRYIINFIPVFIVCAAFGFNDTYRFFASIKRSIAESLNYQPST